MESRGGHGWDCKAAPLFRSSRPHLFGAGFGHPEPEALPTGDRIPCLRRCSKTPRDLRATTGFDRSGQRRGSNQTSGQPASRPNPALDRPRNGSASPFGATFLMPSALIPSAPNGACLGPIAHSSMKPSSPAETRIWRKLSLNTKLCSGNSRPLRLLSRWLNIRSMAPICVQVPSA